jgi:hypothetical protein
MFKIIGADGNEYGPISAGLLQQWIAEGRVNLETRVLAEGSAEWQSLGSFPEWSSVFAAAGSAQPVMVPVALAQTKRTNGFALASLILGIISLCCFCCCYGLPFNVVGLVFAMIGLAQIGKNPQIYQGKGIAVAGLVLCILSLLCGLGLLSIAAVGDRWHKLPRRTYRL